MGNAKIRNVAPILFIFFVIFMIGAVPLLVVSAFGLCAELPYQFGEILFWVLMVLWGRWLWRTAGVRVLSPICNAYNKKIFSDHQIQTYSWLLSYCIFFSVMWSYKGSYLLSVFVLVLPPCAFWITYRYFTHKFPIAPTSSLSPSLLLLRVFRSNNKAEKVFDSVVYHWRHLGPVTMIGAPDLARTYFQPQRLLEFLAGHLENEFIHDADKFNNRLSHIDDLPDPDGRFRVNEFMCTADIWESVAHQLIQLATVILVDLRKFKSNNEGILREIKLIQSLGATHRVVAIVDKKIEFLSLNARIVSFLRGESGKAAPTVVPTGWLTRDKTVLRAIEQKLNDVIQLEYERKPKP